MVDVFLLRFTHLMYGSLQMETIRCKKCGYVREETDSAPDYECPKCGVVYAKVEARLKHQEEVRLQAEAQLQQKMLEEKESVEAQLRQIALAKKAKQEAEAARKKISIKTYRCHN